MGLAYETTYKIEDEKVVEIHKMEVHRFKLGDVEDIDVYAADPIMRWQETDAGKFVMERAIEPPVYHTHFSPEQWGTLVIIIAKLLGPDATFYRLKYL